MSTSANSTSPKPKRTHADRRAATETAWDDVRDLLSKTYVESIKPDLACSVCHNDLPENAIVCDDCGPSSSYCMNCCNQIHQFVKFHKPQIWKVLFVVGSFDNSVRLLFACNLIINSFAMVFYFCFSTCVG